MNKFLSSLTILFAGALLFSGCDTSEEDIMPKNFGRIALYDDFYSTSVNQPVSLDILANDTITTQAELTIDQPLNGELIPDTATGTYLYKPYRNLKSDEVINYTVCKDGDCQTATIRIKVMDMGVCQVKANPDFAETKYPKPVRIENVIANDNTCGRVAVKIPFLQVIDGGTAEVVGNSIIFTPTKAENGIVRFYYEIRGSNGQDKAWVTVKVTSDIAESISGNGK